MALNWFKRKKTGKKNAPPSGPTEKAATPPLPDPPADTDDTVDPALPESPDGQPSASSGADQIESVEPEAEDHDADEIQPPDMASEPAPGAEKKGLFARLKSGLAKTRAILTTDIEDLFSGKQAIDEEMLEELEELLITSDIGVQTVMDMMAKISKKASRIGGPDALKNTLRSHILELLTPAQRADKNGGDALPRPQVVMIVGVNGVGKTTTIGKLAVKSAREGKKVLIAAADTFRAAAIEQLTIWAQRAGADIVKHKQNTDPAAVAYDAVEAALARGVDTVYIDTAGRLHTKVNLMEELKKIKRTIAKLIPEAPHETLLVLDATTGQNALSQAKLFDEALDVDSLALTKLDGTAKGGIVVSITSSMKIPLTYIGVGEGIEDLQAFDPEDFVKALF